MLSERLSHTVARPRRVSSHLVAGQNRTFYQTVALLEWAGERLLSLRIASPKPRSFAVVWPTVILDPNEAFGYTESRSRIAPPTAFQISMMDRILDWLTLIADPLARRVVALATLVNPQRQRHSLDFTRVAHIARVQQADVVALYVAGVKQIARRIGTKILEELSALLELHDTLRRKARVKRNTRNGAQAASVV